jgi:hypothetical protein
MTLRTLTFATAIALSSTLAFAQGGGGVAVAPAVAQAALQLVRPAALARAPLASAALLVAR